MSERLHPGGQCGCNLEPAPEHPAEPLRRGPYADPRRWTPEQIAGVLALKEAGGTTRDCADLASVLRGKPVSCGMIGVLLYRQRHRARAA
jgi:hypothetical protein